MLIADKDNPNNISCRVISEIENHLSRLGRPLVEPTKERTGMTTEVEAQDAVCDLVDIDAHNLSTIANSANEGLDRPPPLPTERQIGNVITEIAA
jgi:hypothetical protein